MTGFRLALGGAQQLYGIRPDMTCLGKIVGGGLPAAAYGGRADIMATVAPEGPVYQAGTLSGNPLAMAAGAALLDLLAQPGTYDTLEARSARLEEGLRRAARDAGATVTINRVGSMITVFFCAGPVTDYATAKASDTKRFGRFFHAMLERGVYLPPAQFEAAFVSLAHGEAEIDLTVAAAAEAFRAVASGLTGRRGRPGYRRYALGTAPPRLRPSSFWIALRYSRFLLRSASGSVVVKFAPRTTSPGSRTENSPPSVSALAGR